MTETEEITPYRSVSHGPYDLRAGEPSRVDPQTAAMLVGAGMARRGGSVRGEPRGLVPGLVPIGAVTPENNLPEVTTPEAGLPPEVAVKSSPRRRGRRAR